MGSLSEANQSSKDDPIATKCPHMQSGKGQTSNSAPSASPTSTNSPFYNRKAEHEKINPLNNMEHSHLLEQDPINSSNSSSSAACGKEQVDLSNEREKSSIPRSDSAREMWMYPSQKMFFNALKRKGFETESKDVEIMVEIHNFLNEGSWNEVLRWEQLHKNECKCVSLTRFLGKPDQPSIKAKFLSFFGISPRPFDRHDWYIDRCGKEIKYVIDYYSAPPDEHGNPVFNVDVRPAMNSISNIIDRARMYFCPAQQQ